MFTSEKFHCVKNIWGSQFSHPKISQTSHPRKNGCSMLIWKENEIISYDNFMFDSNLAQDKKAWFIFSGLLEFWVHKDLPIWILLHSISRLDTPDKINWK